MNITKEMKNELLYRVNKHNEKCVKVMDLYDDENCNEECVETMVAANIEVGIEYCCWMMKYGFDDARVDMVSGEIIPKSECDIWATHAGKPRYLSFEFVDEEEA